MIVDMTAVSIATIISSALTATLIKIFGNKIPRAIEDKINKLQELHAKPLLVCELNRAQLSKETEKCACDIEKQRIQLDRMESKYFSNINSITNNIALIQKDIEYLRRKQNGNKEIYDV